MRTFGLFIVELGALGVVGLVVYVLARRHRPKRPAAAPPRAFRPGARVSVRNGDEEPLATIVVGAVSNVEALLGPVEDFLRDAPSPPPTAGAPPRPRSTPDES
jgi:hypothetical protein